MQPTGARAIAVAMLNSAREVGAPTLLPSPSFFGSRLRCPIVCLQVVLAFATGAVAGLAGTFQVTQTVWHSAQQQGEAADAFVVKLHKLQGSHHDAPRRQVRFSAPACNSLACVCSPPAPSA